MLAIGVLIMLACTGLIWSLYLMKVERQRQVALIIADLEGGEDGGSQAEADPAAGSAGLIRRLQRLMPQAMMEAYAERLSWAGKPYGLDAAQFVGLKLILAAALPALVPVVVLFRVGSEALFLMLLMGLAGFLLPDAWLGSRVGARRRLVQEELPLFADLVATSVSAGLSLTEAVRRVAADAPGLVAREFLRAVQEMAAGKQRVQSWRDLMDRLPGDELRSIVTAIMQAEQYGTSVSEILRYQVQQIRTFNCRINVLQKV